MMSKIISGMMLIASGFLLNSVKGQMNHTDSILWNSKIDRVSYQNMRGGLPNSYIQFTKYKTGRVAFMGGSITEMEGWREKVCQYLIKRFPDTKFEFIGAGLASTGSIPGAFRLVNDVLSKGEIDLLFEEAAVNDGGQTAEASIRGMEGIVNHVWKANRFTDILIMHFVDQNKIKDYNVGKIPAVISAHDKVANYYNVPVLNLAKEVTDRINAGEFTWEDDFKDIHPSPFGHELYYRSIRAMLERCWDSAKVAMGNKNAHDIPEQMDPYSYVQGTYADIHKVKVKDGWFINEKWRPTDGKATRKGFVDVPMLISEQPGQTLTYTFKGTAIGICVVAGPDSGIIEYSIDGGELKVRDLFTEWSDNLYLNSYLILDDELSSSKHELSLRISDKRNEKSEGHACRIVHLLVNKSK
jgi:sialidase-1